MKRVCMYFTVRDRGTALYCTRGVSLKICVRCGSEALLEPGPTELDVAKEAEHDKQNAQAARVHGDVSDAERGPVSHVCGRM